jgi:glucose/arabinose dehydrogenase
MLRWRDRRGARAGRREGWARWPSAACRAAALAAVLAAAGAVHALEISEDPRAKAQAFEVTSFAGGLDYPYGMAELEDGSLLVGSSQPLPGSVGFGSSSGRVLRLVDADGDGSADGPGVPVATGLPGSVTCVRIAGRLVLVSSAGPPNHITLLRRGATPGDPLTPLGSVDFTYEVADAEHGHFTLAVRPSPTAPGSHDVFFNLGAATNAEATPGAVVLSGLLAGSASPDSISAFTLSDPPGGLVLSNLRTIATGLRNAAGIAFAPNGDLLFEDNGIDGLVQRAEPLSADELNRIPAAAIGAGAPDFGFASSYVAYRTGVVVGGGGVAPLVAFLPLPDPATGSESEGPAEIAFAPPAFPESLQGVFVGFHGQFNSAGLANEENPIVFADPGTGSYFHFVSNDAPDIGHADSLLATQDALYVADMAPLGHLFNGSNDGQGRIWKIRVLPDGDGDDVADDADNCPYAPNADQSDAGGVGAATTADGIGDACQCGDVTGDGRVTASDAVVVLRAMLQPPLAVMAHPERCDVGGSFGCSTSDAAIVRRALLTPPTSSIDPGRCPPARP